MDSDSLLSPSASVAAATSAAPIPPVSSSVLSFDKKAVAFLCAACLIVLVTMGMRQSLGLFVQPIVLNTGMSIALVSLAMAIGQVLWGFVQPIAGMLAERLGVRMVAALGLLCLGGGLMMMPLWQNTFGVFATFGILSAVGAGFASLSLFLGAVAQTMPSNRTNLISSVLNAASSLGQFVFAPLVQLFLSLWSWANAAFALGAVSLASLPLLLWVVGKVAPSAAAPTATSCCGVAIPVEKVGFRVAWGSRSYRLLHLGFFACGFHIAFLTTHLPGAVSMCGLPTNVASTALAIIGFTNVAGSLTVGQLCQKFAMQKILGSLYLIRVFAVLLYMVAPKTETTWYLFAGTLGVTWLATVPPTAGLVGRLFGLRNISTLFGLTMLSHQIGAFLGASLGGVAVQYTHSYNWMWWADAALALLAAITSFAVRPTAENIP